MVDQVTSGRTPHRIPHRTGKVLRGLVNVEGELLLCLSLTALLGIQTNPPAAADADGNPAGAIPRLIVATFGEAGRWAFAADAVPGIQSFSQAALQPVPATLACAEAACVEGMFDWNGRPVALLDDRKIADQLKKQDYRPV